MCNTTALCWEPVMGSTLPLFVQYILGLAGLVLLNVLASGRYLSSAPGERPQVRRCTCNRSPRMPDGKRWVLCDRCNGVWDRTTMTLFVVPPVIGFALSYVAMCLSTRSYALVDPGFARETAAAMLAMSVNCTVIRFWVRGLAPVARRLRAEKGDKASGMLLRRLDQYRKQKELRRDENSVMSEELLEPSVLTNSEYWSLLAAAISLSVTIGTLIGAWFAMVPGLALAAWSAAFPEQVEALLERSASPIVDLVDWLREEWRSSTKTETGLKAAEKTAAELAAELAKETDPIRVRAIKEALLQVANTARGALGSELIEVCRDIDALQKRARSGEPKSDAEWTEIWREHASSHRRLAELESKIAERSQACPPAEIPAKTTIALEPAADVPVPMTDDAPGAEPCNPRSGSEWDAIDEETLVKKIQRLDSQADSLGRIIDASRPATTEVTAAEFQRLWNDRSEVLRRRWRLNDKLDNIRAKKATA